MPLPQKNNQYFSLGTTMVTSLILAYFIGDWIDRQTTLKFPLFTLLFTLFTTIGLLIKVIKDTSKKK